MKKYLTIVLCILFFNKNIAKKTRSAVPLIPQAEEEPHYTTCEEGAFCTCVCGVTGATLATGKIIHTNCPAIMPRWLACCLGCTTVTTGIFLAKESVRKVCRHCYKAVRAQS